MPFMGCIKALLEGFSMKSELGDRPIGLKALSQTSDDELLNQLAEPTRPVPMFQPTYSKKEMPVKAPAFVHVPQSSFRYPNTAEVFRKQAFSGLPRRPSL